MLGPRRQRGLGWPGGRSLARYETGGLLDGLSGVASAELEQILVATLKSPATRQSLRNVTQDLLEDEGVRRATRSYLWEAALWLAGGVTVGVVAGRALSRPKKGKGRDKPCSC